MKHKKKIFLGIVFTIGIVFILLWAMYINTDIQDFSRTRIIRSVENLPKTKVGIVFWAKVKANGLPSDILVDRLDGSIRAYRDDKIQKIIVSGDNSQQNYDEPTAMKNYLVSKWITESDIFLDYAGFDTYDTLYRAREIFSVSWAILFSQEFHLPRAIFIGQNLWIDVYGFPTDYHQYINQQKNTFREYFACIKAWLDVEVWHSKPKFLGEKVEIQ